MTLQSNLLARLQPWRAAPAWQVAFSGGLDSTVLLHLLVQLSRQIALPPIHAIHVHHGLQAEADAWAQQCQRLCDALAVPLRICPVQVDGGASLERAAREARYAAFAEALGVGEVLLLAQHRDDQAETVLYRLLRGAGVRGLVGIPAQRPLAQGHLLRPLLDVPREHLQGYARQHGLSWVDDPSNADTGLARNFLRAQILPRLREHWPQATAVLARAAAHQADAQVLLDELAEQDLEICRDQLPQAWLDLPALSLQRIRLLSDARQRNLLRYWLTPLTRLPDARHWQGWRNLRDAADDAQPIWSLESGEMRRHGGRLLWLDRHWLGLWGGQAQAWERPESPLSLPGNGQVWIEGAPPAGELHIVYRQGGEVLDVPGRGRRDLKRLLQEQGVPEFARSRLPLLVCNGELVAAAEVLDCMASSRLRWQPHRGGSAPEPYGAGNHSAV